MTDHNSPPGMANRWRRFAEWDERPLRLDKFAAEDPAHGFAAFHGANDPRPGLAIANGRVVAMDGVAESDFDMIDAFVARHHLDPAIAEEAMAVPSGLQKAWRMFLPTSVRPLRSRFM